MKGWPLEVHVSCLVSGRDLPDTSSPFMLQHHAGEEGLNGVLRCAPGSPEEGTEA
jgi:hypothetical protein